MSYTINEVASKFGLSAHTIRYYDKEGLLPFIARNKSGNRIFTDDDLDWLKLICCLKDSGMPIKEIKTYCDLCLVGSRTSEERKNILLEHRKEVVRQLKRLKQNIQLIDTKIAFYDNPDNVRLMEQLSESATTK
ncbi:MerR family transcriptional regulator [Priestia abyssalis]|uniref:MerR family transcriptional regulator n=1 Tax=Priestia abyssalis TaxID=1221450 RepID=UPI0009954919|nr:MerR family transcriptional regulator [Priestia abyssalis]